MEPGCKVREVIGPSNRCWYVVDFSNSVRYWLIGQIWLIFFIQADFCLILPCGVLFRCCSWFQQNLLNNWFTWYNPISWSDFTRLANPRRIQILSPTVGSEPVLIMWTLVTTCLFHEMDATELLYTRIYFSFVLIYFSSSLAFNYCSRICMVLFHMISALEWLILLTNLLAKSIFLAIHALVVKNTWKPLW